MPKLDEQLRSAAHIMGNKVRNHRIESGLLLEAVARAFGCEVTQLEAAKDGTAKFTPAQIVDLCPILRVMPSWFFNNLG